MKGKDRLSHPTSDHHETLKTGSVPPQMGSVPAEARGRCSGTPAAVSMLAFLSFLTLLRIEPAVNSWWQFNQIVEDFS